MATCEIYRHAPKLPLFDQSPHSVLDTLVKYFQWFCEHIGVSKESFSAMLDTQNTVLPPGNNLPSSYEAALRTIEPYLVQPVIYDVCPNDCILFWQEYADLDKCPKCGSCRYLSEQSHTAVRCFTYTRTYCTTKA